MNGNYQNCYAVPSRGGCQCVGECTACGLENNQVINANPYVEPDKRFTPNPQPNAPLDDSRLRPEAGELDSQPREQVESQQADQQQPQENLPAEPVTPTDGL